VLVATPIGNLGDLSPRAGEALAEADLICCEDTRRTRGLLTHAGISGKRLLSLHEHNERDRIPELLSRMRAGETVAVVSDAGMPGISDPGGQLVAAAVAADVLIEAVPGANAALVALVVSGLSAERFCFEGFLPRRGPERHRRVSALAGEERTTVLYESPNRVGATLADLEAACGGHRRVVIARELTKLYEEVWRGTLAEAVERVGREPPRGEVVLVLEGAPEAAPVAEEEIAARLSEVLATGVSVRDAASTVARTLGISRHRAYDLALALREKPEG
jgi:16S rRNA (cytidine1402-2'-O)-methyltransferase